MRDSRVLIIDDSLTIRTVLEELLAIRAHCHAIATAPDVATARARIADFYPTIITLDLAMPGIDGLALLDELRGHPHAPIVVVSSSTPDGSAAAEAAMARGADACFDKSRIVADAAGFIRTLTKASLRKQRRVSRTSRDRSTLAD